MARRDEEGYYFIVDRKKELVIRGGFNVYPREVEEVLYEHEAVREAAVIGVADESLGEEVAAVVALRDGAEATPEELRDTSRPAWRPTSTRATSGSWTSSPRARRARSSSARSRFRRSSAAEAQRGIGAGRVAGKALGLCEQAGQPEQHREQVQELEPPGSADPRRLAPGHSHDHEDRHRQEKTEHVT